MKTPFVQLAGLTLWGALSMFTLPNQAFAGDEDLQDFVTETGRCSLTEEAELLDEVPGFFNYSYTLDKTQIFKNRGISRETGTVIPPFTRLNCLARNNTKMLVTSAKTDGFLSERYLKTHPSSSVAHPTFKLPFKQTQ